MTTPPNCERCGEPMTLAPGIDYFCEHCPLWPPEELRERFRPAPTGQPDLREQAEAILARWPLPVLGVSGRHYREMLDDFHALKEIVQAYVAPPPGQPDHAREEAIFKAGWEAGFYDGGGEHDCRMFPPTAESAWQDFQRQREKDGGR